MTLSQKLIDQYQALRNEVDGCILLMEVGVFMQVMDADAHQLSELTSQKFEMAAGDFDKTIGD